MNSNQPTPPHHIRQIVATLRSIAASEFPSLSEQQPRLLRLALNEAEALAWETGVPHLVFPALAMEKLQSVAAWHARQRFIPRTEPALALAI